MFVQAYPALPVVLALLWFTASGSAPARAAEEAAPGQDVTIVDGEQRTIYEYRVNGVLRRVKIVPRHGPPYYLVPADPTLGNGDLEAAERLIPQWVVKEIER